MRKASLTAVFLVIAVLTLRSGFNIQHEENTTEPLRPAAEQTEKFREISGIIKKGETLFEIFKRYGLDIAELFKLKEASANVHRLKKLNPGQHYKIIIDSRDQINSFIYWINDDEILNISRTDAGYNATRVPIYYEKRLLHIGGFIKDNLISSLGEGKEKLLLALQLSDIFAWDIDFTTDLRNDDMFKIVVEGLYLDGNFRKYGDIVAAEFTNNGKVYPAYRFEYDGEADYYDSEGNSLRKAFLKAPLSFRRISSSFSRGRYHPILKINRPHHGIDYAAPAGTPVSAVGDGTVIFSGYKGQYGKLVTIRHPNGYKTYYGHLSRIHGNGRSGSKVRQGDIIGYVGSTGLATGPHLHYEVRINNQPINPGTMKIPRGKPVPKMLVADFLKVRAEMAEQIASIKPPAFALVHEDRGNGRI